MLEAWAAADRALWLQQLRDVASRSQTRKFVILLSIFINSESDTSEEPFFTQHPVFATEDDSEDDSLSQNEDDHPPASTQRKGKLYLSFYL